MSKLAARAAVYCEHTRTCHQHHNNVHTDNKNNLDIQETELVHGTYGDDVGVAYAESIKKDVDARCAACEKEYGFKAPSALPPALALPLGASPAAP